MQLENGRLQIKSVTEIDNASRRLTTREIRQRLTGWFFFLTEQHDQSVLMRFYQDAMEYLCAHAEGLSNVSQTCLCLHPEVAQQLCQDVIELKMTMRWLTYLKEREEKTYFNAKKNDTTVNPIAKVVNHNSALISGLLT